MTADVNRVFSVRFTPDNNYVLSGSDDGNIRVWRTNASSRSGMKSAKQRQSLEYEQALIKRYAHIPEIRRIRRHRHLPKVVKKAKDIKDQELGRIKRKEENVRRHSKKETMPRRSEREKMILGIQK